MSKPYFLLLFFLFALASCDQPAPAPGPNQLTATDQNATTSAPAPAPEAGPEMYTGIFEAEVFNAAKDISYYNKITMAIESVENSKIKGYSVVAGNKRPFEGTYTEKDRVVSATAKEPGDDQYDGVFTFQLLRDSQIVRGTWKANNRKLGVTKRKYELKKRVFQYDPNIELDRKDVMNELDQMRQFYNSYVETEGEPEEVETLTLDVLKFNASNTALRKEDVENMHQGDLEVIRNCIYARHGYSFKNRRMRYVFDLVDWYMPVSTDITAQLTPLELKNIDLLKRYEQHAAKYYDSFGR